MIDGPPLENDDACVRHACITLNVSAQSIEATDEVLHSEMVH
jgi:hypothetical protein